MRYGDVRVPAAGEKGRMRADRWNDHSSCVRKGMGMAHRWVWRGLFVVAGCMIAAILQGCIAMPGGVELVSPAEGARWAVGTTRTIRWNTSGSISQIRVELSRDGGGSWEVVVASVSADAGSCPWLVTDGGLPLPQTNCVVRVTDADDSSVSDSAELVAIQARNTWYVNATASGPGSEPGRTWSTASGVPSG